MSVRRKMQACRGAALAAALLGGAARAAPLLQPDGAEVEVFSHTHQACDALDIPDAPARAIRLADGSVQLYATHFLNRRLRGPSLLSVRPDCTIVYRGGERDDPAAFDDRSWIAAPFTPDGRTVFAVLHDEFQGHRRAALCPSERYLDCWYNALTLAVSHDAGTRYVRVPGEVAVLPYRYDEVVGAHSGYFNPTNILRVADGWVMMAFATHARAQLEGNVLLRTARLDDPAGWRGWDGAGFNARFRNPYQPAPLDGATLPLPVARAALRWPVTSLVRHASSGRFIALMMAGAPTPGMYASTSADLLDWSPPELVLPAIGPDAWRPGMASPVAYPSLLDPSSSGRNFETVGDKAVLFMTRFNPCGDTICMDRDLLRMPVRLVIDAETTLPGEPRKNP